MFGRSRRVRFGFVCDDSSPACQRIGSPSEPVASGASSLRPEGLRQFSTRDRFCVFFAPGWIRPIFSRSDVETLPHLYCSW